MQVILTRSLLTCKNTCVAGGYPRTYSQVLCVACQHWGLAGGSIVVLASACVRRYLIIIILFNQQAPPGACVLMCTKMIE